MQIGLSKQMTWYAHVILISIHHFAGKSEDSVLCHDFKDLEWKFTSPLWGQEAVPPL